MRLYLSGPMSGLPEDNFPAFFEAQALLEEAGYVVVNPARGSRPTSDGRIEYNQTPEYEERLRACIKELCTCEGLAVMSDSEKSKGAAREQQVARFRNMHIGSVRSWLDWDYARAIRWVGDPACEPRRHYEGDAGFDLYVSEDVRIAVNYVLDVPLGISVELPPSTWGLLTGRSSTIRKRGLHVAQSIIDNGYRGPLFVACHNVGDHVAELKRGERVAQLVLMPLLSERTGVLRVDALSASDRGANAFGSSGT